MWNTLIEAREPTLIVWHLYSPCVKGRGNLILPPKSQNYTAILCQTDSKERRLIEQDHKSEGLWFNGTVSQSITFFPSASTPFPSSSTWKRRFSSRKTVPMGKPLCTDTVQLNTGTLQWNLIITVTYGPNISGCYVEVAAALQRCKCIKLRYTWDLD